MNRALQFVNQVDISRGVKESHELIDATMEVFNVTSSVELHRWTARHEEQRRVDQDFLVSVLSEIKDNLSECVKSEQIEGLMKLLQ